MKLSLLTSLVLLFAFTAKAQLPDIPEKGSMGTFSEWKDMEVQRKGGQTVTYSCRIALESRHALTCLYLLEIKNTSSSKLKFNIKTRYYAKFGKSNMGDKTSKKIDAGSTETIHLAVGGCKKMKDEELSDYENCVHCPLSYFIDVE